MPRPRKKPYATLASIQSPASDSEPDAVKLLNNTKNDDAGDPSSGSSSQEPGDSSVSNSPVFSNWSLEECLQLIEYIKTTGFDGDMKKICERFPGHTETNIRHFMNALTEKGAVRDPELGSRASVLEQLQKEARTNSLSQSYGSVLPTFVEWKAMFETHPHPATCDGVDYAEIYRSIASLMRGEVPRALSKPTAEKFLDIFDYFLERVNQPSPELFEPFMYKQPVGSTVKTQQQCNTTLANRRSTKWTCSELLKGHVLITADLRRVREIYLSPAWANPFRFPDELTKFRHLKIARRKKTSNSATTVAAGGDDIDDAEETSQPVKKRRRRRK